MCDNSIQLNMDLLLLLTNIIDEEKNMEKKSIIGNKYLEYFDKFQNILYDSYNIPDNNNYNDITNTSLNNKPIKNVSFNDNNEYIKNQRGGNNGDKIIICNKKSTGDKIRSKCNVLWANNVKELGKKLNIKPEKGKKTLSKAHVINQIVANKKLHTKALKELNKFDLVQSESMSESK
uniref:Uncharacterized protein n=1 Tax=Moumouvirus australiensis transpoviron TaxID=2711276 RepID=A0A2P1EHI4_9VIRU|nr:hypothetical protein matv_2 [Moumouvirus australiensis transpoviron]